MTTMNREYMLDGMMGLVVGDALGCPVQFLSREEIKKRKNGPVTGMEGYGTYNMPVGTWTDDSSMALAALASINEKHGIDMDDIMQRFCAWHFEGDYTPFGEAFDQGITCMEAIARYKKDHNVQTCGRTGEYANGNGALMRILPICIYLADQEMSSLISHAEAIEQIHGLTALTHNHLRSLIASGLYYFMVSKLMHNRAENYGASLKECLQLGMDEGIRFYGQQESNRKELSCYHRLFHLDQFSNVSEECIYGSGYVLDSIEAAVWCLINTSSFEEALLKAVNLGEDTDTIAAIAGGLAGLYYGYESIPSEWKDAIQERKWVEDICAGKDVCESAK